MIVPASCQSLVRIGFFYDARIDERKASQGIPALRTVFAVGAAHFRDAGKATIMPVQSGMTRATPKADNDPTVFVNAESRAGFFIIEIASYSSYYTIALGRIDGSISRTQQEKPSHDQSRVAAVPLGEKRRRTR